MTPQEVAALFRVSRRTVYRLIDAGALKAFRVGRQWRVSTESVTALSAQEVAA